MKTKNKLLNLLLLSVFLLFGTGCSVFRGHNKSRGVIIESRPIGRLKLGEIDNMSGKKNAMPVKKNEKSGKKNKKSKEKNKESGEKNKNQYEHWQTKKNKRR